MISSGRIDGKNKLACFSQEIWTGNKYEQKSHATKGSGAVCEYLLRMTGVRST